MVKVIVVVEVSTIVDDFEDVSVAAGQLIMAAGIPFGKGDWEISNPVRVLEVKAGVVTIES